MDNLIFLPVESLTFKDLYDWSKSIDKCKTNGVTVLTSPRKNGIREMSIQKKESGSLVKTNQRDIALFRYKQKVFAVKEFCPHADGPLHMGDIEDLGDDLLCVKCPWHGWKIDLQTGKVVHPKGHDLHFTKVYPVKVKDDGALYIGFTGLDSSYFDMEECEF